MGKNNETLQKMLQALLQPDLHELHEWWKEAEDSGEPLSSEMKEIQILKHRQSIMIGILASLINR